MKLVLLLVTACVVYSLGMRAIIKELRTHPSQEERRENQSVPLMLAATTLFLATTVHTTRLAMQGVLPLL